MASGVLNSWETLLANSNSAIERTIREIREAQAEKERTRQARSSLDEVQQKIRASRPAKRKDRTREEVKPQKKPISVGDHVVLDGGTALGVVQSVKGPRATVAFELAVMKVEKDRLQLRSPGKESKSIRRVDTRSVSLVQMAAKLDLRGFRVADAIPALEKYVDDALRTSLNRLEILHGTGTGALRVALWEHLKRMPEVTSFEEAPIDEGGAGVTYVFLS